MRMEHKSPLPDIEFNPSLRPFESNEKHIEIQAKPLTEAFPVSQQHKGHTEHDHSVATKTFENIKYTTFEPPTPSEPNIFTNTAALHSQPATNFTSNGVLVPNTNYSSVSNRVKTIDQFDNDQQTISAHKPSMGWNVLTKSPPVQQYFSEKQSYREDSTPTHQVNGSCTPNPVSETIDKFSNKIQEYEQSHWSEKYDLKAPALVRHVSPNMKPVMNGYLLNNEATSQPLHLEPGAPPELCFAPRQPTERKSSIVERIEKSLERELEKGPSKVLPHSVRMMPPSPQTVSTEMLESNKSIMKQMKHLEFNEPTKDFNHIKNIFYEHEYNKPLQRKTFVRTPTLTQAPEKVRTACFRVQFRNVLTN